MSGFNLGPLVISFDQLWLILAFVAAWFFGWIASRGKPEARPTDALFSMAFVGLVVARLVFVLHYLSEYLDQPLSIIDIRDGGFDFIGGLVGMAIYAIFKFWRRPAMRRPLGSAIFAGVLVWGATGGALNLMQPSSSLPEVTLTKLNGHETSLSTLARQHDNKPMVVNLWASWCPPCRAEMPMLEKAQKNNPDITFLFVNQGETPDTVHQFIESESLDMDNLLLDDSQSLASTVNARAFPTTLFYDESGRLVNQRMGMLSSATLKRSLKNLKSDTDSTDPHKERQ